MYIVESGLGVIRLRGGREVHVPTDSLVLLPHAPDHSISAGEAEDGAVTQWLEGTFEVAPVVAHRLFRGLPDQIVIDSRTDPDTEWLLIAAPLLAVELERPLPGSMAMVSRVLDLLFIRTLRTWAAGSNATPGWLTGCMDPHIGESMAALHGDLSRRWTVPELASIAGMSRSSFADRFQQRVGQAPGSYLQDARLATAADLLRTTDQSIARLAESVGYSSDAAFSRAFQRVYGMPPSAWRAAE
jgi:AraC-like DNA-binding protein